MDKVLLVIPAYNEEKNIERVVDQLTEGFPELDYIVVNDGSKDRTADIWQKTGLPPFGSSGITSSTLSICVILFFSNPYLPALILRRPVKTLTSASTSPRNIPAAVREVGPL